MSSLHHTYDMPSFVAVATPPARRMGTGDHVEAVWLWTSQVKRELPAARQRSVSDPGPHGASVKRAIRQVDAFTVAAWSSVTRPASKGEPPARRFPAQRTFPFVSLRRRFGTFTTIVVNRKWLSFCFCFLDLSPHALQSTRLVPRSKTRC